MKKRIILSILVFVLSAIVAFSYFCPQKEYNYIVPKGEAILTYTKENIVEVIECTNTEGNTFKGESPHLVFENIPVNAKIISIDVDIEHSGVGVAVFYGMDKNFSPEVRFFAKYTKGEKLYMPITKEMELNSIKLGIGHKEFQFNSIEIYEETEIIKITPEIPVINYILAFLLPLLFSLAIFFLDFKIKLFDKILCFFSRNKKNILITLGAIVLSVLTALLVEYVLSLILKRAFYFDVFMLLASLLFTIFVFVYFFKEIGDHPEKILALVILSVGALIIFASPFSPGSWDSNKHFDWTFSSSYFINEHFTNANNKFVWLIVNEDVFSREINAQNILELNELENYFVYAQSTDFSLFHFVSGVSMALARGLGLNFFVQCAFAKFANLLLYIFTLYFGIKRLKSGKMIASVIALLPTSVFLASNFSYDYWVMGFSTLGFSYFAAMLQEQDKPFSIKDTIIMCSAMLIACLPKLPYVTLLVFTLFLRKRSFTKKDYKKYYLICISTFVVLLILLGLRSFNSISGGGDLRGGDGVNSTEQLAFILSNPLEFLSILFNFLKGYLSFERTVDYISFFAYFGHGKFYLGLLFLLIFTAFTDKNDYDKFKGMHTLRFASLLFLVGTSALMATALYISFTSVGSLAISGCQPRYILPLLFPTLILVGNPGIVRINNKKWYNTFILSFATLMLYADVFTGIIGKFY